MATSAIHPASDVLPDAARGARAGARAAGVQARERRSIGRVRRSVPLFAAVDLGTNNCRLLIAEPTEAGFQVVDAFSRIVRLGEGVATSGRLSEEAMRRTVAALRIVAGKIHARGVATGRAVATEACRRAVNFPLFRDTVRYETGLDLELIDPTEEARLAAAGCAPLLDPHTPRALIFDIGGGSTELMWIEVRPDGSIRIIDGASLPHGVVSLSETFGGADMTPEGYRAVLATIRPGLEAFEHRNQIIAAIRAGRAQMIGSSGTVTTLAGVGLGLRRYNRAAVDGTLLKVSDATAVCSRLLAMDYTARAAHPCIGRERADLVLAGCAVFEAICGLWPVEQLRVADRGVREGILLDLIAAAGWH